MPVKDKGLRALERRIMAKDKIKLTPCKACCQLIHFVQTKNGRFIPCNNKKLSLVTVMGDVVSGWETHFSNCPGADSFRKKRKESDL